MKSLSVAEAQGQLAEIITEVNRGELVVLKNGDQRVTLFPGRALDLDEDSPDLEAELLKGIEGPFTLFSPTRLRERTEKIVREISKQ
jgi:hypothetical protein